MYARATNSAQTTKSKRTSPTSSKLYSIALLCCNNIDYIAAMNNLIYTITYLTVALAVVAASEIVSEDKTNDKISLLRSRNLLDDTKHQTLEKKQHLLILLPIPNKENSNGPN